MIFSIGTDRYGYMFSSQARYGAQHGKHETKIYVVNPVALKHVQLEKNKSMWKNTYHPFLIRQILKKKSIPIILPLCSHCIPACSSRIYIYPRVIQHRKMAH